MMTLIEGYFYKSFRNLAKKKEKRKKKKEKRKNSIGVLAQT